MKIAIIGAGAAGMMAAAAIVESGADVQVVIIDRNPVMGRKVMISGGGRCNVTTGVRPLRNVFEYYPRGARFLRTAFHQFPPEKVYEWFEAHGVPLKIEEDLRVFPQSDNGEDVVGVFVQMFREAGVEVLLKRAMKSIVQNADGGFVIRVEHNKEEQEIVADKVIFATGGQAYRHTGSVGDGYTFAESLGHSVTALGPSLNALHIAEEWPKQMSGISFERATLHAKSATEEYEFTGPFVLTHQGISGPAVFALSALIAFEKFDKAKPLNFFIDFAPDKTQEDLRGFFAQHTEAHPKQLCVHSLQEYVPKRIAQVAFEQLSIPLERTNVEVSKKDKNRLVEWIKRSPLHVIGRGAGSEFVTAGGVELSEVNPNTMESRITPGVYFAGEILNVDGFTGGFNLQASWAAGRLAGQAAVQEKE